MNAHERARLEREAEVFARHLASLAAPSQIREHYVRAHELGAVAPARGVTRFDRALVACARAPWLTRTADAYASVLARDSLLRRKLVLMLALLEVHGESAESMDRPSRGQLPWVLARALWTAGTFALLLAAGALVFTPLRAACGLGGAPREVR